MFKFTDEQKAYIFEKLDEQIKNSEEQTSVMKKQFAQMKENIDDLSTTELCGLLSIVAIFAEKENTSFTGGFNGKLN